MYSRTHSTRFLDRLAVMLRTLCAHPRPVVGFRSGANELADPTLAYLSSRLDGAVLGSPPCANLSRVCCSDSCDGCARGAWTCAVYSRWRIGASSTSAERTASTP